MNEKIEFVELASRPGANVAALCREKGITRQTGYKWIKRFEDGGYDALEERSRRPKSAPLTTAEDVVSAIVEVRRKHPSWGPRKLMSLLARQLGEQAPSERTIARVLERFGQIRKRRKRAPNHVAERAPEVVAEASNDVWTIDFKGWWRSRDGARCEPLTIRDAFSRFVLTIKLMSPRGEQVRAEMEKLFRKHGVPKAIQCDNGSPFASVRARGGLSWLSAWWVSLGIALVRSRPAHPQDNGAHERMHRDMAVDIEAHPEASPKAQQRACDKWRQEFNHVRPHDALAGRTPAEVYKPVYVAPSVRSAIYPSGWLVRRVLKSGDVAINRQKWFVSTALRGHFVAFEPMTGLRFRAWFHRVDLGEIELTDDTVLLAVLSRVTRGRAA